MLYDEQTQTIPYLNEVMQLPFESSVLSVSLKKLYIPPKLVFLLELNISNSLSGGGDGDAALAHS